MNAEVPVIKEKHDGALDDRASVKLWLRLLSCTMAIEKELQRRLGERGATLPRFDVLAALDRAPDGLTMGALSRALLVSNGNVTGLVRKLAAEGLVAIETDQKDRRSFIVRLTERGSFGFKALAADHSRWVDALLAEVPPAVRDDLYDGLGALKVSVGKEIARGS